MHLTAAWCSLQGHILKVLYVRLTQQGQHHTAAFSMHNIYCLRSITTRFLPRVVIDTHIQGQTVFQLTSAEIKPLSGQHMLFMWPTFGSLDAGVLVVTEEESLSAAALVAAHHVDTNLLTPTVAFWALVHICRVKGTQNREKRWNYI